MLSRTVIIPMTIFFFFFNDTATTEIYTLSLHDALPISVMVRDKDFGAVRLRAFGTYDFRIVEPAKFLKEVAGTGQKFPIDEVADTKRPRIINVFTESLAKAPGAPLGVAQPHCELGGAAPPPV